jgi:hypothetical protein
VNSPPIANSKSGASGNGPTGGEDPVRCFSDFPAPVTVGLKLPSAGRRFDWFDAR